MSQATERMQNATQGIPRNQIPSGDEDLCLKSEIVPPVCPACQPSWSVRSKRNVNPVLHAEDAPSHHSSVRKFLTTKL